MTTLWNHHDYAYDLRVTSNEGEESLMVCSDEGLGWTLSYEEVTELVNVLQKWLRDHIPAEPPEVVDDMTTNEENAYMPYVQRLNEAMNKMQDGLKEIGKVTREMDENELFGNFRQTLAISEQNFVSAFMLYKTLMVDAIAALSVKRE